MENDQTPPLELLAALADFQNQVPIIQKNTEGFKYVYADLPKIIEVITPLLKKTGLGFYQQIEGVNLRTVIFHTKTGRTLESVAEIPQKVELSGMNEFQVIGSAITYFRRYALSAALGLVTDTDSDAAGDQTPKAPGSKPVDKDLPWLNHFTQKGGDVVTEQWTAALKYLGEPGGSMDTIKKKYRISKKDQEDLENEVLTQSTEFPPQ